MTTEEFTQILKSPSQLRFSDLPLLNQIIVDYPYFQAVRAIQLKSLKDKGSYLYNQKLKETAAYTTDREVLFNFITSKAFSSPKTNDSSKVTNQKEDVSEKVRAEATEKQAKLETTVVETEVSISEQLKISNKEAQQIVDPNLFERKETSKDKPVEIEVDAPIPFNKNETHSFAEWLRLSCIKPIERVAESVEPDVTEQKETPLDKKALQVSLIDQFIENNPKISPVNTTAPKVNLASENNTAPEDLMTETLAKVYLAQKNYKKAIQAYKILILKNPEKSGLFADQIRAIEKLKENK